MEIPVNLPSTLYFSIFRLRLSAMIIYNRGERGKPCLSPREAWKKVAGLPFTRGAIQGAPIQDLIHLIKCEEKPTFSSIENKNECLTWSNALAMSNLIMSLRSTLSLPECRASCTKMILSNICLF
jgi:hypothetical protein